MKTTISMDIAIGIVIKAFRQHLSYKQDFVAYKANITTKTLANIENGRVGLDLDKLYKLGQVFCIPPSVIVDMALRVHESGQENWLPNAIKTLKTLPKNNNDED